MRYIKQGSGHPPKFKISSSSSIHKIREPSSGEDEQMVVEFEPSKAFRAPDRDEVYHVKMPAGELPKTKIILEKQRALREQGVIKRGVTGIRKSGVELQKTSLRGLSNQSKSIVKRVNLPAAVKVQETDTFSSTTIIPSDTMRSDAISKKVLVVADEVTDKPGSLSSRFQSLTKSAALNFSVKVDRQPRKAPMSQRKIVTFDDMDALVVDSVPAKKEHQPRSALSISERIQIVRKKPVVTVHGRPLLETAHPRGRVGRTRKSILDRISVTK